MKSSICSAKNKGIDGDMSDLAIVDCLGCSEEGAIESTLSESVASVNPDVLVVSTSIHESRKLILRMALQIVCLIAEINVAGNL
jgi:hypothetical protein